MSDFGRELARLMDARGTGVRELGRQVPCNPGHISNLRSGRDRPSPQLAARLDEILGAGGALVSVARGNGVPALAAADEVAALELARRAQMSDVGGGTCERLELIVDDLAVAYPTTPAVELLGRVRAYLGYVTQLMDGRATLAQRRRLLVTGGWLSLLTATCLIDLHADDSAAAYLRTAAQLADETSHSEIAAWVLETRAWQALTAKDYRRAVALSQAAQDAAREGSVFIQATAQEGRAWARMGDAVASRDMLARVETLVSPLPVPDRPEHHYRYDPNKARIYVGTTLAWLGDTAAEPAAREILADLEIEPVVRPRRVALARIDLAKALAGAGKADEAAATATAAVTSGRMAPVDWPRAAEVVGAVAAVGVPESRELADAYRAACGGTLPAVT